MVHIIFAAAVLVAAIPVGSKRRYIYLYSLSIFALFVFAALRYDFGNDYMSYYNNYMAIKHGYWNAYGKQYLYSLINYLSPSYTFLVAIISLFFLLTVYKLLKYNLPVSQIWLGLFIFLFSPYIFLVNLSAMRQCLAMLLFVFAIRHVDKSSLNGFIKYVICIVVASLIHKSAIILLPVYFFANSIPIRKNHIGIMLGITLVLLLSEKLFPNLLNSFLVLFDDKNYSSYYRSGNTNSMRSVMLSLIPLTYIFLNAYRIKGNGIVYTKLTIVSFLLSVLASQSTALIRVRMYFEIFSIITIPQLFFETRKAPGVLSNASSKIGSQLYFIVNKYVFPILIIMVYLLKYYNFFRDPVWRSFLQYKTILWG